jgi:hypothetical protein
MFFQLLEDWPFLASGALAALGEVKESQGKRAL